jgi:hypothetical protein
MMFSFALLRLSLNANQVKTTVTLAQKWGRLLSFERQEMMKNHTIVISDDKAVAYSIATKKRVS